MVDLFEAMTPSGYEQVVFCHDRGTGLRSIIAIHDTTLGPALGGVRMWPYPSEEAALDDCLRLARAMTYKAAGAGLHLGGGKSVILGDPQRDKTEALLRAHGRFIQTLGGRYIPGIDVGTEQADMEVLAREAERVSCLGPDPSPLTALGVLSAMRACASAVFGSADLTGRSVAIQGAGHVGAALAGFLAGEGAKVLIADLHPERADDVADRTGAQSIAADEVLATECDILSPCALGGVINDTTLPTLRCRIVAGAANNILEEARHAEALAEAGVLYAPDYVANAGGLIWLEEQMSGRTPAQAEPRIRRIQEAMAKVIARAEAEGVSTAVAAERIAEARLVAIREVGPPWVP
jgi:glutamate dehydrogenase/leucine dehydrogenase